MLKKYGLKISIAAMAVIAVIIVVILISLLTGTRSLISNMLIGESETANKAFSTTLQELQSQALERAEMIASSESIINAVVNNDSEALLKALNTYSKGLDLITLCDKDGIVLVRTHSSKSGDSVINQNAISTALSTGKGISTLESGTEIGLSTRGSAAIKDANGNIIGALTCGHDLSQTKYVDDIKNKNNCEVTFFAGDTRMNTTLIDEQGNRVIGTKANDAVIETVLNKMQDYNSRLTLFGKLYECHYSPVITNGKAIGMIFTGVLVEDSVNQEQTMIILIIIAAVLLLIAVIITIMVIRWITKKTYWYESMLDSIPFPISVTDSNMNWTFINSPVEQMLGVKRDDVLGKHCSNWGAAICNTENCGINCLNKSKNITFFDHAGMDFQVNTSYLTDKNSNRVGHIEVVQDITSSLSSQKAGAELVGKIQTVSESFVSASQNIADGANALAQSSIEQAAAVEQLSGSIYEIAEKTQDSANMASKAAELSETIKQNAEKGSAQMDKMTQAVQEINESSQSISKVIKAIDDIAFQTNILALNAAVEAARAGQHGKGFAVVADEVRNLAAKSSESAKDSSALIENSMEKAQIGVQIAMETAGSLRDIVTGIGESSKIIKDISNASDEQSTAISEINKGIDQVSQNIQQNSATAEESAAASAEMSTQSALLKQLIDDFDAKQA